MPYQCLPPIKTTTKAGFQVVITEIDVNDDDMLHGQIDTVALGIQQAQWNDAGFARNWPHDCNIDTRTAELQAAIATAKAGRP